MKFLLWFTVLIVLTITAGCKTVNKGSDSDSDSVIDSDSSTDTASNSTHVAVGDAETITDIASSYSTEPDPQYAITYLLTEFEQNNHHNAEGVAAEEGRGYLYMFDDPNTNLDFVAPHAKLSPMCKEVNDDGDLTDEYIYPMPEGCNITTGYEINQTRPFENFGSRHSFHMTGTVAGEGLGLGVYFSNYMFYARRDDENRDKLKRDDNGNIPAFFNDGRYDDDGQALCSDDWKFASVVPDEYKAGNNRLQFDADSANGDTAGKYSVTGAAYGPGGAIYTEGWIWEDAQSGSEEYELKYNNSTGIMKEPRCLAEMNQEGFVMWATGDATVEVALMMPESTPLNDGGICDGDAMEKCQDYHRKRFVLDGEWREFHASWDEFLQEGWGQPVALDPNRITDVHIKVVAPQQGAADFDIWLDHIGFYGGITWPFVTQLADTDWIITDTETEPGK